MEVPAVGTMRASALFVATRRHPRKIVKVEDLFDFAGFLRLGGRCHGDFCALMREFDIYIDYKRYKNQIFIFY